LGSVGVVQCAVALTVRPWELGIDAIVVSVGEALGGVGQAGRAEDPNADWNSIDYSAITPARPMLLDLRGTGPRPGRLQMAVLATPHEGGAEGLSTLRAVGEAVTAAIQVAAKAGATTLGIPLLSAGILEVPAGEVSAVVVPAAMLALQEVV